MNRRHNILILASILCVILAVTAMFVLQRRNRSVIYRIESTIIEQNEMLCANRPNGNACSTPRFSLTRNWPKPAETRFFCACTTICVSTVMLRRYGNSTNWRSNLTFRYKPPEPIITMRHSGKRPRSRMERSCGRQWHASPRSASCRRGDDTLPLHTRTRRTNRRLALSLQADSCRNSLRLLRSSSTQIRGVTAPTKNPRNGFQSVPGIYNISPPYFFSAGVSFLGRDDGLHRIGCGSLPRQPQVRPQAAVRPSFP